MNGGFFYQNHNLSNGKRYGTDFVGEENAMVKNGTGGLQTVKLARIIRQDFFRQAR